MPLFCPTGQLKFLSFRIFVFANDCYGAWGCFRHPGLPTTETSVRRGRTQGSTPTVGPPDP
jgi:hypothetical protein